MQRNCDGCDKPYQAKRADSKFCGSTCRSRASVTKLPSRETAIPGDGPLTAAAARELTEANRLDTRAGQQALALARRIDSPYETGAAVASLSKALSEVMAKALDGVRVVADPLDELRARRAAKSAG